MAWAWTRSEVGGDRLQPRVWPLPCDRAAAPLPQLGGLEIPCRWAADVGWAVWAQGECGSLAGVLGAGDRQGHLRGDSALVLGVAAALRQVVEPCFAPFFLTKLLGKHNFYYDLQTLDPPLFANLQQLKSYSGDVSDLCLSFVASSEGGEVPLVPRGQEMPVTAEHLDA